MNFRENIEKKIKEKKKVYSTEKSAELILEYVIKILDTLSDDTFNKIDFLVFGFEDKYVRVDLGQTNVNQYKLHQFECLDSIEAEQIVKTIKQKLKEEGFKFKSFYLNGFTICIKN